MNHSSKNRITFRISAPPSTAKEEILEVVDHPLLAVPIIQSANTTIHDAQVLPQMLNVSGELHDTSMVDAQVRPTFAKLQKQWLKITISAISAVTTGIILGLLILSVVNQYQNDDGKNAQMAHNNNTNKPPVQLVNVPATTLFGLQIGVFSTLENVANAQRQLTTNQSQPAIQSVFMNHEEKFHLFLGITSTRAEAEELKRSLKGISADVIVKNITLPAISQATNDSSENLNLKVVMSSRQFIEHLLTNSSAEQVKTAHRDWVQRIQQANAANSISQQLLQGMMKHLNNAFLSWTEYRQHAHPNIKRDIQIQVLNYINQEHELLIQMK